MDIDIRKRSHDFYWLKLNTVVLLRDQPVKLTEIKQIKRRREYEFTNIFTEEKFTETVPDLHNHRFYWDRWSQGTISKRNIFLDEPVLQRTVYQIIDVILPNKIICLDQEIYDEKTFEISEIIAIKIQLLLDNNPDLEQKVTEICWRGLSVLEFERSKN